MSGEALVDPATLLLVIESLPTLLLFVFVFSMEEVFTSRQLNKTQIDRVGNDGDDDDDVLLPCCCCCCCETDDGDEIIIGAVTTELASSSLSLLLFTANDGDLFIMPAFVGAVKARGDDADDDDGGCC